MMAARKQSMVPSEGRRKSVYPRKASVDGKQAAGNEVPVSMGRRKSIYQPGTSLEVPVGMGRRPSNDGRRMSIMDIHRKQSMADSLTGRSGVLQSADKLRGNVRYENTYKLEPDEPFSIYKAKCIAEDTLKEQLEGKEYNKDECTRLSKTLSDSIKQQVKLLGNARFKVVTLVAIGQTHASHPSLSFTSRCIWNDKTDNFAEASFKSKSLFAVALVYILYTD